MIHWHLLLPWFLRAWPVLALVPVGLLHAIALRYFAAEQVIVNKAVGMSLQVLGGLLVLYSVNDNLGLFRSQSLTTIVIAWFKGFPLVHKPIVLSASMNATLNATGSMSAVISRAANTLEERVAELERRLPELQSQFERQVREINDRIQAARSELEQRISATSTEVKDLSKRLEHASVGGFKFQAFGVILAIYGAFTSLFA